MTATLYRYGGGTIRCKPGSGRTLYCADISHAYRRMRKQFVRLEDAKAWMDERQREIDLLDRPMSPAQIADYLAASAALPKGQSLYAVAQDWLAARKPAPPAPLGAMIADYVSDLTQNGRRPATIEGARHALMRLAGQVGALEDAARIDTRRLEDALRKWGAGGYHRDGYIRYWRAFFNWGLRVGRVGCNPALGITRPRRDDPVPVIFTPGQADDLLAYYRHNALDLLPELALGLFAGLRPAEISGMAWGMIEAGQIRVTPAAAKLRRMRLVPICPRLAGILADCDRVAPLSGRGASDKAGRTHKTRAAKAAGLLAWPKNATRHSYISYRYAQTQDVALVAAETGTSPDMIFRHYRALVTPESAAEYFRSVQKLTNPLSTGPKEPKGDSS